MARRCFRPWTARLTLAMGAPFSLRWRLEPEQATDLVTVAAGDLGFALQSARAGRGLLLEHVVVEGPAPEDLARARHLEALGRASVGLHLRHLRFSLRLLGRLLVAPGGGSSPLVWCEHHDHVAAVELGGRFHLRPRGQLLGDAVQDPLAQLGVGHLPSPEHDRDLHLVALVEELTHLACLGVEVAAPDLGPVLHLLDRDVAGLAARLLVALGRFVLPFAVVEDLADRRVGHRGHLDEVKVELPGDVKRLGQGLDPELAAVGVDEAHLSGPDAVVDADLVVSRCCYATPLPERETSGRWKATSALWRSIDPDARCCWG